MAFKSLESVMLQWKRTVFFLCTTNITDDIINMKSKNLKANLGFNRSLSKRFSGKACWQLGFVFRSRGLAQSSGLVFWCSFGFSAKKWQQNCYILLELEVWLMQYVKLGAMNSQKYSSNIYFLNCDQFAHHLGKVCVRIFSSPGYKT